MGRPRSTGDLGEVRAPDREVETNTTSLRPPKYLRRASCDNSACGNVFSHKRVSAYDCAVADSHAIKNRCASSDPRVLSDNDSSLNLHLAFNKSLLAIPLLVVSRANVNVCGDKSTLSNDNF